MKRQLAALQDKLSSCDKDDAADSRAELAAMKRQLAAL